MVFQSTLPARGATDKERGLYIINLHFNPRSPHGERQPVLQTKNANLNISIHAPRTGSDAKPLTAEDVLSISIHAPRTGSDRFRTLYRNLLMISIHAPRTGSDAKPLTAEDVLSISIHAPRTGSDRFRTLYRNLLMISIHAPRTGSDARLAVLSDMMEISIHAPRTGSDAFLLMLHAHIAQFQSTLPARGATSWDYISEAYGAYISIHAPRTGSDAYGNDNTEGGKVFQSTLPARGATLSGWTYGAGRYFNPRSPHGERPAASRRKEKYIRISIHAPRTGSDRWR